MDGETLLFTRKGGTVNMSKKVPDFRTEEEEARFWDEHDTTEFIDDFETVEIELSPELEDKNRP